MKQKHLLLSKDIVQGVEGVIDATKLEALMLIRPTLLNAVHFGQYVSHSFVNLTHELLPSSPFELLPVVYVGELRLSLLALRAEQSLL
jgi:hypothetical protein